MGSTSRKMRRQSDKLAPAQKKVFTEDEAFRHVLGYAPPTGINDLKDAVNNFLLEPQKYPTPDAVVKKWRGYSMSSSEIIDRLINIYAYTEDLAMTMLDSLAPGAGSVMMEELYDLVPDQNDKNAASVRQHLLSSDDGRSSMRHWVWGASKEEADRAEAALTPQQREIDTAVAALERAKPWPKMRVREDVSDSSLNRMEAGHILRDLHPAWDPITQSTNRNEALASYAEDVDDKYLVEDMPRREDRLEEILRLQSIRSRTLSEIVYRGITLAYTALEQQKAGLGEAYVEEMTREKYSELTDEHKLCLVDDDGAK
jgi:hypothetical protein